MTHQHRLRCTCRWATIALFDTDPPEWGHDRIHDPNCPIHGMAEDRCTCLWTTIASMDVNPPEMVRDRFCPIHGEDADDARDRDIERRRLEREDRDRDT